MCKECTYCGNDLDNEELESPRKDDDGDIICDNCYSDNYMNYCPLCEEEYEKPTKPEELFFCISNEVCEYVAMNPIKPGIYQTTSWPYFLGATGFGFEMLFENSIKLVRELNINSIIKKLYGKNESFGADEICDSCVDKYTNMNYRKRVEYTDKWYRLHRNIYERGIIKNGK